MLIRSADARLVFDPEAPEMTQEHLIRFEREKGKRLMITDVDLWLKGNPHYPRSNQ